MEVLSEKLHENESKDSRFVELIYHLVHYYKVDIKFLQEYKTVFSEPELSDQVSNFIQMKERNLFLDGLSFTKLNKQIKKKIKQVNDEAWFKYFDEKYIDNSKSLNL